MKKYLIFKTSMLGLASVNKTTNTGAFLLTYYLRKYSILNSQISPKLYL